MKISNEASLRRAGLFGEANEAEEHRTPDEGVEQHELLAEDSEASEGSEESVGCGPVEPIVAAEEKVTAGMRGVRLHASKSLTFVIPWWIVGT